MPLQRGKVNTEVHTTTQVGFDEDILFGKKKNNKKSAPRKSSTTVRSSRRSSRDPAAASDSLALTTNNIKPGMLVLGCIRELRDLDVSIQLENGLVGSVSMRELSDEFRVRVDDFIEKEEAGNQKDKQHDDGLPILAEYFHVGQYVCCIVLSVNEISSNVSVGEQKKSKRIELSMRATLVNQHLSARDYFPRRLIFGSVESIEDKGYIINIGKEGQIKGFMQFTQTGQSNKQTESDEKQKNSKLPSVSSSCLKPGAPVTCIITSTSNPRVLLLSGVDTAVTAALLQPPSQSSNHVITITSLQPGMLVEGRVCDLVTQSFGKHRDIATGIKIKFLDMFVASVDASHCGAQVGVDGWQSQFKLNDKVKARILSVNYITKHIGLTLMEHIINMKPFEFPSVYHLGTIIPDAVISKIEPKRGIYLKCTPEQKPVQQYTAFAHLSRISDDPIDQVPKHYQLDQHVKARIVNFSYLDGCIIVSLAQKVLEQAVVSYDDLKAGMKVPCIVMNIDSNGLIVRITQHISAFIEKVHCTDSTLHDLTQKFKVGQQFECRVLTVDIARKRVRATLKKSLLNTQLPIITDSKQLHPNIVSHGWIGAVKDYGLIIQFYNGIHGLVNISELRSSNYLKNDQQPQQVYQQGQVHKVRIVRYNSKQNRLQLSFNLQPPASVDMPEDRFGLLPGNKVSGTVSKILSDGVLVECKANEEEHNQADTKQSMIDDDHLPASSASSSHPLVFLSLAHMSDNANVTPATFKKYPVGTYLDNMLVLYQDKQSKQYQVSIKPSLLQALSDSSLPSSYTQVHVGSIVHGYVHAVTEYGVFVRFLDQCYGLAPRAKLTDFFIKDISQHFHVGQSVVGKVLEIDEQKQQLTLTLKPSMCIIGDNSHDGANVVRSNSFRVRNYVSLHPNMKVRVRVHKIIDGLGIKVQISKCQYGIIHMCDLADEWQNNILDEYSVGQVINEALVLDINTAVERKRKRKNNEIEQQEEGEEETEQEQTDVPEDGDVASSIEDSTSRSSSSSHRYSDHIALSIRPSRLKPEQVHENKYEEIKQLSDLGEGQLVHGYVKHSSSKGVFIWLNRFLHGRVELKNLSDGYVTNVNKHFPLGKYIPTARILSVDTENGHVELTLRKTAIKESKHSVHYSDLHVGDKVKGTIHGITNIGVFVRIKHSAVTGLCHISEVSDTRIEDLHNHYEVGDHVRCLILKKDDEKQRISLGMKHKYFADQHAANDMISDQDEDEDEEEVVFKIDPFTPSVAPVSSFSASSDSSSESSVDSESEVEMDEARPSKKTKHVHDNEEKCVQQQAAIELNPSLSVSMDLDDDSAPALNIQGEIWAKLQPRKQEEEQQPSDNDRDNEENDNGTGSVKLSRRAKSSLRKHAEQSLLLRENALLADTPLLESAEDYERLVVQAPNSSIGWIQYMAYQISLTELDLARKIAERALKSIHPSKEVDKRNVRIAWINLENLYGTQEAVQHVVDEAIQYHDPLNIYLELAKIYAATNKQELARDTYELCVKKYHQHVQTWLQYGLYLFHHVDATSARELLKRALQRLPTALHIDVISKFACYEFQHGSVERGRTLLEGILSTYPKKIDLWNVYLDMELKLSRNIPDVQSQQRTQQQAVVRRLLDRMTSLKLSSKKMKFFFKRYLTYEREYGDEEHVEMVKNKAKAYVQTKLKE